jgi:hypothetical protein
MGNLVLCALLGGGQGAAASWRPPKDPDPRAILEEAKADSQCGRYETALAKFLWFHHHALKYDQALTGVRLSFALGSWYDLAQVYPPALEALTKTRDDALVDLKRNADSKTAFEAFSDFESINRQLGEESWTARVFADLLDTKHPTTAQRLYHVARPALLRAKEYQLCGKYLRPEEDWLSAAHIYQLNKRFAEQGMPELTEFSEKSFTNEVATLLALLVVNGRQNEAEKIAQKARLEWDSPTFHAALDSALGGSVPDPWP